MYGLSAEVGAKIIKGACHNFITGTEYDKRCNRFRVGDVVAVAQSYNSFYNDECDPRQFPSGLGWTNKMYVKSELMPHCIRITNVRLERLQDISEEDCFAEGIYKYHGMRRWHYKFNDKTKNTAYDHKSAREAYADLIDRISGKGTWKSNPWVLVYDFELIK